MEPLMEAEATAAETAGTQPEAHYRAQLAADPTDRQARTRLHDLLLEQGRWDELAGLIDDASPEPSKPEPIVLTKIRPAPAPDTAQAPDEEGEEIARLEKLLSDPALRAAAGRLLEPIYRKAGDFGRLAPLIESRLSEEPDPGERGRLTRELMHAYEHGLAQKPMAFLVACRAFGQDPRGCDLLAELERLAFETGSLEELAMAYEQAWQAVDDPEESLELVRRLARLKAHLDGEKTGAVALWHRVLAVRPADEEALAALAGLCRELGDFPELAEVLESMVAREQDEARQVEILRELARIYESRLDEPGLAFAAAARAFRLCPQDARLQEELERLAASGEKWEELCGLYLDEADRAADGGLQESLRARARRIRDAHAGEAEPTPEQLVEGLMRRAEEGLDQAAGIAVLRESMMRRDPAPQVALGLVPVYRKLGRVERLAPVLEACLSLAEERAVRLGILSELARIAGSERRDPAGAVRLWGRVLAEDPRHLEALGAMVDFHRERGDLEQLAALLRRLARLEPDTEKKKDLLYELAMLLEDQLGQAEAAAEAYMDILAEDPQDLNAMKLLNRLCTATRNFDPLLAPRRAQLQ